MAKKNRLMFRIMGIMRILETAPTLTQLISKVVFRSTLIDHWKSVNLNVTFQDEASKFWFWLFV